MPQRSSSARSRPQRWAIGAVGALVLMLCMAPTGAVATTGVAFAAGDGTVPYPLTAKCQLSPPIPRDLSTVEYIVTASAEAEGPAVGTSVTCFVYGDGTGARTGGCSGGGAGPVATCVDRAWGLLHIPPRVCVEAWALYADQSRAATRPCP